jgi:hypothetical protein
MLTAIYTHDYAHNVSEDTGSEVLFHVKVRLEQLPQLIIIGAYVPSESYMLTEAKRSIPSQRNISLNPYKFCQSKSSMLLLSGTLQTFHLSFATFTG